MCIKFDTTTVVKNATILSKRSKYRLPFSKAVLILLPEDRYFRHSQYIEEMDLQF